MKEINKVQSSEIQNLDLNMDIEEVIAVRIGKDKTYRLIVITSEGEGWIQLSILVSQKNKVRQFKTLDAVDSFLLGIDIYEFTTMSEENFNQQHQ
jgi:hypothetical protein